MQMGRPKTLGVVVVALVLAALAIVFVVSRGGGDDAAQPKNTVAATPGVPAAAVSTLKKIDSGEWPAAANAPGTKGGDTWRNRDHQLPDKDAKGKAITYQEWDVNPKQRGQTRDAERIITGSDGSAWYTGDHYKTFTRMR